MSNTQLSSLASAFTFSMQRGAQICNEEVAIHFARCILNCLITDCCWLTTLHICPLCVSLFLFSPSVICASRLFLLPSPLAGSILDVKSSICCPARCPQGAFSRVITALVYSVNVCQMDAAPAACARKGPPWEKRKRRRRKHFDFLPERYFHHQQLTACCSEKFVTFYQTNWCNYFCHRRCTRLSGGSCHSNHVRKNKPDIPA